MKLKINLIICLTLMISITGFAQTKIVGDKIQPYSIAGIDISYTPTTKPIATLHSSTRNLEVYQNDYIISVGKDNRTSIVVKENGKFKAYIYYAYGSIDKFEIVQLNSKGLPELILRTHAIQGNGRWSITEEHDIVVDFDENKVLWDLCSDYDYGFDGQEKKCAQTLKFSDGKLEVANPTGNLCNPTPQDATTEYKKLKVGTYLLKDGSYTLPN